VRRLRGPGRFLRLRVGDWRVLLRDADVRAAVLAAVPADGLPILEVGPGRGALTAGLAAGGRSLVAVEFDEALALRLRPRLPARDDLRVLHGDILDVGVREALAAIARTPPAGLVGNLPYAITAPLLRRMLSEDPDPPPWLVVMVQREVARQVVAPPGRRSLLSVSVQFYAEPESLFDVPPGAFEPPPAVHSTLLRLRRRAAAPVDVPSEARFFEVVRAGFAFPRKQLHNALARSLWLAPGAATPWLRSCEIDPARRAATLTLEEWARLAWERERSGAPPPAEARRSVA
jgi:16S rRNA (adenine1518-N6/adenine1519-N6)-dimethyltransferase